MTQGRDIKFLLECKISQLKRLLTDANHPERVAKANLVLGDISDLPQLPEDTLVVPEETLNREVASADFAVYLFNGKYCKALRIYHAPFSPMTLLSIQDV